MRTSIATIIAALLVGIIAIGSGARSRPTDPPAAERIIAIVGGDHGMRGSAIAAADAMPFGDIQGFYVAPSDAFDGETPGRWLLVSAFRTARGAAEFEELLRALRIDVVRRFVTTYRGTTAIGLGQEPHPDGTGPLTGPLPAGHPERIETLEAAVPPDRRLPRTVRWRTCQPSAATMPRSPTRSPATVTRC